MSNVLLNFNLEVEASPRLYDTAETLLEELNEHERLYSYIVRNRKPPNGKYTVQYMVSQTERYNTIENYDAACEIAKIIHKGSDKVIMGYRQPPLELLVEIFEPLVRKLSMEQSRNWKKLEYEDLYQTCYWIIIKLYNEGYYIHKSLVRKSFANEVLNMIMGERDAPIVVPLQQKYYGATEDLENLTIGDIIMDESYELEQEERDRQDFWQKTFNEVKEIIVDLVGPRQFDQLFRDYAHKHTTAQTRKMMQKVKTHLALLGITLEDFINKYYG